jgi:transcriptional regulator with XRE-family HTH domain
MNANVTFGEFVKSTRLENGITAREASQAAEILPSNFSKLEHGVLNPPQDPEKQKQLANAIGISPESEKEVQFFDLAAKANASMPVDLADIISRDEALPLLLRTIGNKRLGKAEIERLVEIVRGTASASQKLR